MRYLVIVLTFMLATFQVAFSACTTKGDGGGDWGSAGTWTCSPESAPPGCVATIIIQATDSVYIASTVDLTGCGPINIFVHGKIGFKTGRKLKLADGSTLDIQAGGSISPGGGGGSSNYLEIGGNQVWTAADGPQSGPLIYNSGGILPINLISFEANVNEDRVDLKWITAAEVNNNFFTIEKSENGKAWEVALVSPGAGNSSQMLEYFESDYSPKKGVSYYRLKQTDYDGKYTYSNIVPVKFIKNSEDSGISLFPSPVRRGEQVKVVFEDIIEEKALVVLRNIKGNEYYSKVILNIEDGVLVAIPIDSSLPPGMYLVTASSENQMYSQKLLVK